MIEQTLPMLQTIDLQILAEPVRQAQRDPAFQIHEWTVQPLAHEKIIDTTGGLFLFSGTGSGSEGKRPWSIVLKVLNHPEDASPDIRSWAYWKREVLAFQSGMLAQLPSQLRAPRCFGTLEREQAAWIWMEHVREATDRRWSLDDFHRAAYAGGLFGAAYLTGQPQPDAHWLSAPFFRSILGDGDWWAGFMAPTTSDGCWSSPLVQSAFNDTTRAKVLRVWTEKHMFWDALDRLPQVFCHNDFHRRNLMFQTQEDGRQELIALDWAFCGPGAVGMDMGELVANTSFFFDSDPLQVAHLEATVLDGYLDGLRTGGWSGDIRLARLGYLISAVLWMGATLPGWAAGMLSEDSGFNVEAMYGQSRENVLAGWVSLTEFLMERADEARSLIRDLHGV